MSGWNAECESAQDDYFIVIARLQCNEIDLKGPLEILEDSLAIVNAMPYLPIIICSLYLRTYSHHRAFYVVYLIGNRQSLYKLGLWPNYT